MRFPRVLSLSLILASLSIALPAHVPALARAHRGIPYIVVLDPGHGGEMYYGDESGAPAAVGPLLEKEMTLTVALQTRKDLEKMGYTVYLTRTRDQRVNTPPRDLNHDGKINHTDEFVARNVFANSHHADVFVSIHFDGSTDQSMNGTHGYWCPDRPFWRSNKRLSIDLVNSIVSSLRKAGYADQNGGVETDVADKVPQEWPDYPWFLVLGPSRPKRVVATAMPGALIETLYMSSPRDDAIMGKKVMIAAMAQGYANGIQSYFNGRVTR